MGGGGSSLRIWATPPALGKAPCESSEVTRDPKEDLGVGFGSRCNDRTKFPHDMQFSRVLRTLTFNTPVLG